jgi:hypothetical protein
VTARNRPRFRFVQLEVAGRLGLDDGRYLIRGEGSDQQVVLVVQTMAASAARPPRRQRRARRVYPGPSPEVPLTRLTVISAEEGEADAAAGELERIARDPEAAEDAIDAALRRVNAVLGAHRIATQDPYGDGVGREAALVARIGIGTGDGLAEGRWETAFEVPPPARRQRRTQALRPQERLAALLAGREPIDPCEPLLLRARADLDADRPREFALQLRVGLEALLADLPAGAGPDQAEDLAALEARREPTLAAAEEALAGELSAARTAELAETLAICERVLRRRQVLRE